MQAAHSNKNCPHCSNQLVRKEVQSNRLALLNILNNDEIALYRCFACGWKGPLNRKTGSLPQFSWLLSNSSSSF